ncbi:hypothetical protein [Candidatus Synchoanobacter obligatus]|uniref:Ankyrin repeat domain-containing protein n=1 Tax=Candidatus Synchoanobacter obligatus TaxID=2919597 RepID=A0ABT1L3D0_9GAMM|nr:hypothetical protein [Candidatus Synchoanobacter obligatus]MCP8351734.1 hypothetical protein [Candidatus Synchoanobacter obligatus]
MEHSPQEDSSLNLAAYDDNKAVTLALIQAGANVNQARIDAGKTPPDIAEECGHKDVVNMQAVTGETPNLGQETPVRWSYPPYFK